MNSAPKASALARIFSLATVPGYSLLALALIAPSFAANTAKKPQKEKNPMEWSGSFCSIEKPENVVVKTEADWKALWQRVGKPAPTADFKEHFAVAVFLGTKPTGGYSIEWLKPKLQAEVRSPQNLHQKYVIPFREKKPSGMAIEALTQPYAIKLFAKMGNHVSPDVEVLHD